MNTAPNCRVAAGQPIVAAAATTQRLVHSSPYPSFGRQRRDETLGSLAER